MVGILASESRQIKGLKKKKKVVSKDFGKYKYVTMREADVIRREILQVGHPNFAWIFISFNRA